VVDAEVLEVLEADEQLEDVVLDLLDGEGVEEGLASGRGTMKGLNLKYSSTMCVMSWCTNRFTSFGRFSRFFTSSRNAISA
jgi:hypothetical protein